MHKEYIKKFIPPKIIPTTIQTLTNPPTPLPLPPQINPTLETSHHFNLPLHKNLHPHLPLLTAHLTPPLMDLQHPHPYVTSGTVQDYSQVPTIVPGDKEPDTVSVGCVLVSWSDFGH